MDVGTAASKSQLTQNQKDVPKTLALNTHVKTCAIQIHMHAVVQMHRMRTMYSDNLHITYGAKPFTNYNFDQAGDHTFEGDAHTLVKL